MAQCVHCLLCMHEELTWLSSIHTKSWCVWNPSFGEMETREAWKLADKSFMPYVPDSESVRGSVWKTRWGVTEEDT